MQEMPRVNVLCASFMFMSFEKAKNTLIKMTDVNEKITRSFLFPFWWNFDNEWMETLDMAKTVMYATLGKPIAVSTKFYYRSILFLLIYKVSLITLHIIVFYK